MTVKLLQHTAYQDARKRLRAALDQHRPGHMVFIIGPSGAGKTTLRHSVLRDMFAKPELWGCGQTPVVEAFALLPQGAYYSSRMMAKDLLNELHAPRLAWLLKDATLPAETLKAFRDKLEANAQVWEKMRPLRGTEPDYWGYVQRSITARGCKYVSIDQATALLVNHRDTTPADHTLHLMSLAESTDTMFVMTGIHKATRLWDVHSELRRRVTVVWVPPYSHRRPEDMVPFLRVLASFSTRYPLSKPDLLVTMAQEVMAATGGVFGEIDQLLVRAAARAAEEGSVKLLKRHIEAAYYSDTALKTLWNDIDEFEAAMRPGDVSERSALIGARWKHLASAVQVKP